MTQFSKEQLDPIVDFAAQSIADVQTLIFQTCGYKYDDVSEESLTQKYFHLADYFNKCWKSLILKNDEKIHRNLSNESPSCVLKVNLDLSLDVLNDVPTIESSTKKSQRTPSNTKYVNTLNRMLKQFYKDILFVNYQIIFKPDHVCPRPRLDSLINEDPNVALFTPLRSF